LTEIRYFRRSDKNKDANEVCCHSYYNWKALSLYLIQQNCYHDLDEEDVGWILTKEGNLESSTSFLNAKCTKDMDDVSTKHLPRAPDSDRGFIVNTRAEDWARNFLRKTNFLKFFHNLFNFLNVDSRNIKFWTYNFRMKYCLVHLTTDYHASFSFYWVLNVFGFFRFHTKALINTTDRNISFMNLEDFYQVRKP
jgi:hypothetical protein